VLGWGRSIWILSGTAVVMVFLLFFATLMAFVGRRESPRPPGPN
jgi:Na+-transporting methylmalonyl-CoA/oxaloacetate decarboxylase gamma subunit